jgi:Flp pilus assembly protein TadD
MSSTLRRTAVVCLVVSIAGCGQQKVWNPFAWSGRPKADEGLLSNEASADLLLGLARSFERQGDVDAAMASYQRLVDRNPGHAEALHRLAVLYDRRGEFDKSSAFFHRALKHAPGSPDLFSDIGYSYWCQGRYQDAEINLRQAIALDSQHAAAHNHLGLVLGANLRYAEALEAFGRAGCTPAEGHANLAIVLALHGDVQSARAAYEHARNNGADSPEAHEKLSRIERLISSLAAETPMPEHATAVTPVHFTNTNEASPR